ncbi:MAG TPA: pyridoxamine 5'-phosphate oxidase family protein [Actinomycetota bacterium]|jgi:nitroimidazol reductase NimA-like FMN-containing flavoprotein (pyridoxamine 5'-phosphate oxidase superfamily)
MPIPREQLRLTPAELDELLGSNRTLRAGTVSPDGWPHVSPLWFCWHAGAIWVTSLRRSRRARDVTAGSPVALCVDDGHDYAELRGTVLYGRFEEAEGQPDLPEARRAFAAKYWGGVEVPDLRSHVWLRMAPERVVSWDFRKIPAGRDKRLERSKHRT